jgi:hypothetical protein
MLTSKGGGLCRTNLSLASSPRQYISKKETGLRTIIAWVPSRNRPQYGVENRRANQDGGDAARQISIHIVLADSVLEGISSISSSSSAIVAVIAAAHDTTATCD